MPSLPEVVAALASEVDYVEVSPDTLCRERTLPGGRREMALLPDLLDRALASVGELPVVVHGLELSIGSAAGWNQAYLNVLDEFRTRRNFRWHSEHLGFLFAEDEGGATVNVGVPLPMPFTAEAAALVAGRADVLVDRYGLPFLLENAAYYLPDLPADPGWDEAVFLTELTRRSRCGILLDLFNLYCNCVNHAVPVLDLLGRMPLHRVVEIHVAGGNQVDGFLLDAHNAEVPDQVWQLLDWVLPRCSNIAGLTYEILDSAYPQVGLDTVQAQLRRLRLVWERHQR